MLDSQLQTIFNQHGIMLGWLREIIDATAVMQTDYYQNTIAHIKVDIVEEKLKDIVDKTQEILMTMVANAPSDIPIELGKGISTAIDDFLAGFAATNPKSSPTTSSPIIKKKYIDEFEKVVKWARVQFVKDKHKQVVNDLDKLISSGIDKIQIGLFVSRWEGEFAKHRGIKRLKQCV